MKIAKTDPQVLKRVADNLYRSEASDVYYAIIKRHGKQKRYPLKTNDRELAKRRLQDLLRKIDRLADIDPKKTLFSEYDAAGNLVGGLAKQWFNLARLRWRPTTEDRERWTLKPLHRFLGRHTLFEIDQKTVENWAIARAEEVGPHTYNRERLRLQQILQYAVKHGLILENPAADLPKQPAPKFVPRIPSKAEFKAVLQHMRSGKGKRAGRDSADLMEGLCYLGSRKGDTPWLEWRHCDFMEKEVLITGVPGAGTKNGEQRIIPMFPPLARLLRQMRAALPTSPKPTDRVFKVKSCRKAFETACKTLGLPSYPPHHTWRRFFITNCVEAGVDFRTIAGWVGHKDGGMLVAKTYAVLTDEHSKKMANRVTFDAATFTPSPPATTNLPAIPTDEANR